MQIEIQVFLVFISFIQSCLLLLYLPMLLSPWLNKWMVHVLNLQEYIESRTQFHENVLAKIVLI